MIDTAAKSVRLYQLDLMPYDVPRLGIYNFGNPRSFRLKNGPPVDPATLIPTGPSCGWVDLVSAIEDLPGFLAPGDLEVMPMRKIEKLGLTLIPEDRALQVVMHQIVHLQKVYIYRSWLVPDERRPAVREAIQNRIEMFEKNRSRFEDLVLE